MGGGRDGGGGSGYAAGGGTGGRNGGRLGYSDCVIARIARAPGILQTPITVKVELGCGVHFNSCQTVCCSNERKRAVWSSRGVSQLCSAISGNAISANRLETQ